MTAPEHKSLARKPRAFTVPELAVIILTAIALLLISGKRLSHSAILRNSARATNELQRICELEHEYFLSHEKFGYSEEIGFKERYGFSGILYSISVDSVGFTAFAREATGSDAFGDHRPGNEYFAIDATGTIVRQSFPPE